MKKLILFSSVFLLFCSCDFWARKLCGKLPEEDRVKIDFLNQKYKDYFVIEPIPCEFIEINMVLVSNKIDTMAIKEAYNLLWDQEKRSGWQIIRIYKNREMGRFLMSYGGSGFDAQDKDWSRVLNIPSYLAEEGFILVEHNE